MTQAPIPSNEEARLEALHTGDNITVKFLPRRTAIRLGFLKSVTYADWRVIQNSGGNPND
jgi:hypothetical protein